MSDPAKPVITGVHHISLTATDIDASLDWYQRLFEADRVDYKFLHYDAEDTGYGVLLIEPHTGLVIGIHTNAANKGERFDEARTGLDHLSFLVDGKAGLEAWMTRLDELGIAHTGIRDQFEPFVYSTVVFRDPDNIQLEFIALG